MSWIQTAYLIAEVIAIPAHRPVHARADLALAVRRGGQCLHPGVDRLRLQRRILRCCWLFRIVQGFSGGVLIPAVFSAVFLLFPPRLHARRDHDRRRRRGAGADRRPGRRRLHHRDLVVAVAVPDQRHSRADRGLGDAVPAAAAEHRSRRIAKLDAVSLVLMAAALASLEIGLKQAPQRGWLSPTCVGLLLGSAVGLGLFLRRTSAGAHPVVRLVALKRRSFALGCLLSFCLGVGLFGSVYLMPVFLAFVRGHDAFEIGTIMLVTGVAQLVTAPFAAFLESRIGARPLTAAGFALFALGLGLSYFQPRTADFEEMFWPQILRGVAIMFCLLPPTRIALGASARGGDRRCQRSVQPDAQSRRRHRHRADRHHPLWPRSESMRRISAIRLLAGDVTAAKAIGLDPSLLLNRSPGPPDRRRDRLRPAAGRKSLAGAVRQRGLADARRRRDRRTPAGAVRARSRILRP